MNHTKIIKNLILISFILIISNCSVAQKINGKIIKQNKYLTILKLHGTHKQRGFAYGYLLKDRVRVIYDNYIKQGFSGFLPYARKSIETGVFKIDKKYIIEAKAIISGMASAGADTSGFSYIDILIANSFLDFDAFTNGCSSLMSWGDATKHTKLKGKSVITRNMDWEVSPLLMQNNVIVIHIPSEKDEQPWLMVGYAGQIGVLSGTNKGGLSVFQHMMYYDNQKFVEDKPKYEPIWFSLRKALEQNDFDKSGQNDVNDLRAVLTGNKEGYASGFIVSALAGSNSGADSLIALVAELAPNKPYLTFRAKKDNIKITGDNLFAANSPIKRNNEKGFCRRYFRVYKTLLKIKSIDDSIAWEIMKEKSHLSQNLQTIQVIPENSELKLSIRKNIKQNKKQTPETYDLNKFWEFED